MSKKILYLGLDPIHYQADGQLTHWPIIQIIPRSLTDPAIDNALRHFDQYTHLIMTSKSTVKILQDYLPLLGIDLQIWAQKTTLAVGRSTALYLQACGITSIQVALEETAEGIIHLLKHLSSWEQAHFFWPHSSQARPLIREFLVANHLRHTTCILYDPQPQVPTQALPKLETFDEIVFTSPSTVEAFLAIFGQFPSHACLTPIGPITAQFLTKSLSS